MSCCQLHNYKMIFNAHYYYRDYISFQVWICILASCIFMGSFIYIFTRWFDNIFSNSPRKLSISEVYWFIYGAILRQGSTIDPKSSNTFNRSSQSTAFPIGISIRILEVFHGHLLFMRGNFYIPMSSEFLKNAGRFPWSFCFSCQ